MAREVFVASAPSPTHGTQEIAILCVGEGVDGTIGCV